MINLLVNLNHSAQRPERRPDLLSEELRLFPSREVAAFGEPVVINQFGIGFLGPTPRGGRDLIGKTLTAAGIGTSFGAKKASLLSQ